LVLAVALLLAFLVVRVAVAQSYAGREWSRLARIWPSHPAIAFESGMAEIGARAAAGQAVDAALVRPLLAASAIAPLAPEPFLVRGVEAQVAGDKRLALRAFLAARQRSPRTVAARYLLADHYLKEGQTLQGLAEISALARLVPQSLPSVAPFLAAFARTPGAAPDVRQLLRNHPELEPVLLETLSDDAKNVDLILTLWSGRSGEQEAIWQGRLLMHLIEGGNYELARRSWARFSGVIDEPGYLFDPEFARPTLAPFGWSLAKSPAGVAEPDGKGRLRALFFGREDLVLAAQILTLNPGQYRLSMTVDIASPSSNAVEWTISCLPAAEPLATLPLVSSGASSTAFSIPPSNCRAQRLELRGIAQQFAKQADVTISQLRLQPETNP
jgi:hypothetical protein